MKSKLNSTEIFIRDAEGNYSLNRPARAEEIVALAESILRERVNRNDPLTDPTATRRWLITRLSDRPHVSGHSRPSLTEQIVGVRGCGRAVSAGDCRRSAVSTDGA